MKKQVFLAVCAGFVVAGQAALVDDFQTYEVGVLTDVASTVWTGSTTDAFVHSDGVNQYGHWQNPAGQVWVGRPIGPITDTSVATVYFRMSAEGNQQDAAIGLSLAGMSEYGDFSAMIRVINGSEGKATLGVRNGGSYVDFTDYMDIQTWYNVWMVIDQPTDTFDLYVTTGYNDATAGDLLASDNGFRRAATNDLVRFLSRVNSSNTNLRFDDIHLAPGTDLTVPAAPPPFGIVALNPPVGAAAVHPQPEIGAVLNDVGGQVDTGSVQLSFDGVPVTPNVSKVSGTTTISYPVPDVLEPLSAHTARLVVADIGASLVVTSEWSFTVSDWITVPGEWGYPLSLTGAGERGFWYRDVSYDDSLAPDSVLANSEARANAQLAGRLVNPDTGEPYADADDTSEIEPTAAPFSPYLYFRMPEDDFDSKSVINMNNNAGSSGLGNFSDLQPAPYDDYEGFFPGIFFVFYDFADETIAYLELDPGMYTLGVNSDDGFVFYLGPHPLNLLGADVGRFDGARGAADTLFSVRIEEAGLYPFRLLHYQGGGDTALELFSVKPDGTKVLVNDDARGGIRAWRVEPGTLPPYVSWIAPLPGAVADTPNHRVTIELTDGDAAVDPGTISLDLAGAPAAFTTAQSGDVTTLTYSGGLPFQATSTFTVVYGAVGSAALSTGSFDVVTGDPAAAVDVVSLAPTGTQVTNRPTLEVVLRDAVSEVDPGSIVLSLDGAVVSRTLADTPPPLPPATPCPCPWRSARCTRHRLSMPASTRPLARSPTSGRSGSAGISRKGIGSSSRTSRPTTPAG